MEIGKKSFIVKYALVISVVVLLCVIALLYEIKIDGESILHEIIKYYLK